MIDNLTIIEWEGGIDAVNAHIRTLAMSVAAQKNMDVDELLNSVCCSEGPGYETTYLQMYRNCYLDGIREAFEENIRILADSGKYTEKEAISLLLRSQLTYAEKDAAIEATEIAFSDERTIRDKINEVRGVKVMLDFELAEIYGNSTTAFIQQVRRNEVRSDEDFHFQLTRKEMEYFSISQNVTSIQTQGVKGNAHGHLQIGQLAESGEIDEFYKMTIMDMSERVLANLAASYENIRKGVGSVMSGQVLDYEAKRIRNVKKGSLSDEFPKVYYREVV